MKSKIKSILISLLVMLLFFSLITLPIHAEDTESLFISFNTEANALIGAKDLWQMKDVNGNPIDGTGMIVAIIDSGVDYTHPDLGGGFGLNYKVIGGWDFGDNDSDPLDVYGHGTSDAGVICANGRVAGVAPNAKILAYKVSDNISNTCRIDSIIKAINTAIRAQANIIIVDTYIDETSQDQYSKLQSAVQEAYSRGIPIVAGAGNFGSRLFNNKDSLLMPMSNSFVFKESISVSAFDVMNDSIAQYSSMGPSPDLLFKPDISAPTDIYTTQIGNGYGIFCGTSASAPVVAGCVALIKQAHPDWTVDEIKASLMNNATVKYNPQNKEPITWLLQGAGLVNVYKAVTTPAIITPYSFLITPDNLKPITFTVNNTSDTTQTFSISSELTLGNFTLGNTDGISVSLSDNQVTLNKGETKTVTATISVDKSRLEQGPYEGLIWFDNGLTKLHVPFIIWNGGIPQQLYAETERITDFNISSDVIDFKDITQKGIYIDFTLKYGSYFRDITYSYLSNFIDSISIDLLDCNNNTICNIYKGSRLAIGHYTILWKPSCYMVNNLLLNGLSNNKSYKIVLSVYDKSAQQPVEQYFKEVSVINMPSPVILDVYLQDYIITNSNNVSVKGKISNATFILINDNTVTYDKNGIFVTNIELSFGWNTIRVSAYNTSNLCNYVERKVYYDPNFCPIEITLSYVPGFPFMIIKSGDPVASINNKRIKTLEVAPYYKNNSLYIPLHSLVSAIGGSLVWDQQNKKVTVYLMDYSMEIYTDKRYAFINGEKLSLKQPEIVKGTLMVPTDFFANNLHFCIQYDKNLNTVSIIYKQKM